MIDNLRVKAIEQKDERTLKVVWNNDKEQLFDVVALRRACPCAVCIDEWTHQRKLKPQDVADTVRPVRVESVGRYALTIQFDDRHATGIYTFPMLYKMGELH